MRRAPARPVRVCFVRTCCIVVVQEHDLRAAPVQCNAKRTLSSHFTVHASHPTLRTCTSHSTLHLISNHVISSHLISALLTCHLSKFFSTVFILCEHWSTFLISSKFGSTHLSCSACQKALTVGEKSPAKKTAGRRQFLHTDAWDTDAFTQKSLSKKLCTTKLAQSTSQYYLVLQSLHKVLPDTTLYYKACKALPSTTLYYEACTKHFPVYTTLNYKACTKYCPVPLCTTRLAQSTFQYYFVLQDLHKALPSTTLYYKACTKHFPVLLCNTKLPQKQAFTQRSFYTEKLSSTYWQQTLQLQNRIPAPKWKKHWSTF